MTAPHVPHASPPLDALLARRDWVRRFARTLARDDAAADDLAQDAWVAAVERPPAHADRPAGWLRRVLTRRAMDVARGERRRATHERAAARPEVAGADARSDSRGATGCAGDSMAADRASGGRLPDVGDVVAAAEMHKRVVEEVVALDEPYRTTVLLRFFEDLPPREVAARMGAPVETVRARVRRAVERLRERLDERHGGDRAAWLAPLLPADGGHAVAHAGSGLDGPRSARGSRPDALRAGHPGNGETTMHRTLRITALGAAAVAAAIGGVSLLRSGDGRDVGAAVADDSGKPGGGAGQRAPRPRAERPSGEASDDAAAQAPGADGSVGGTDAGAVAPVERDFIVTVVDPTGSPVSGVRVRIDPALADAEPVAATGADGRATFRVTGPVRAAETLPDGTDGRAWRPRVDHTAVVPGADAYRLVVEAGAWIRGTVRSEGVSMAAGAEVVALADGFRVASAYADAKGAFALAVPSSGKFDLALTGHRREPWREVRRNGASGRITVGVQYWGEVDGEAPGVAASTDGVVIQSLVPPREAIDLRVRVVGADGTPVAGVPVHADRGLLFNQEIPPPSVTDPDGRALLTGLPRRRVTLLVRTWDATSRPWEAGGWAVPRARPFVRPDEGEATLVLPRGRSVRGRVEVPDEFFPQTLDGKRERRFHFGSPGVDVVTVDGETIASASVDASGGFTFLADLRPDERFVVSAGAMSVHGEWSARSPVRTAGDDEIVLRLAPAQSAERIDIEGAPILEAPAPAAAPK